MHSLTQTDHLALAQLSKSPALPTVSRVALQLAFLTLVWTQRSRSRAHLRKLDYAKLEDVGLTPNDAHTEYMKWFWRP